MTDVGRVIWARTGDVVIREAEDADLEVGTLLAWEGRDRKFLLQVLAQEHGSQSDRRMHELVAGMHMQPAPPQTESLELGFPSYLLAHAKPLAVVERDGLPRKPKRIPHTSGPVRRATAEDLAFMPGPGPGRVFLGPIRSGSDVIGGTGLYVDATKMFSHHVLVPATTGRGKSNLIKCMMHGLLGAGTVGALVLDAHGEYYQGLSAHPEAASRLVCYTGSPARKPGQVQLRVNVRTVNPKHFKGVVEFTEAQERMMWDLWGEHREEWIIHLLDEEKDGDVPERQRTTRMVLRQKVRGSLGMKTGGTFCTDTAGGNAIREMARHVSEGRVVVLDTSGLASSVELMIGSMAAGRILWECQQASDRGELDGRPAATIIMEEVPRLLAGGLDDGNAFAVIAREGRKFKVGLTVITQLSSIIPREIMANLGTKIILGNEMRAERDAVVGSAAQDLSGDYDAIASLEVGEAIVSSVFVPFAVPIKVPRFEDLARPRPKARIKVY